MYPRTGVRGRKNHEDISPLARCALFLYTYRNNRGAYDHLDNNVGHNSRTNNRSAKGIVNTGSNLGNCLIGKECPQRVWQGLTWLDRYVKTGPRDRSAI